MLINKYTEQLRILTAMGAANQEHYICPFCLQVVDDLEKISQEDAPQNSLGGSKIALTCKACNNKYGASIDCHLFNYIEDKEALQFPVGLKRQFLFHDKERGRLLRGSLEVGKRRIMKMVLPKSVNAPEELEKEIRELAVNDVIVGQIKTNPQKRKPRYITAALLKNAYVILFSYFGYTFLVDPYYNLFREQLKNPEAVLIPEGFISREGVFSCLGDGVYVCDDAYLRGFLVIMSLKRKENHQFGVFFPVPLISIEDMADRLKKLQNASVQFQKVELSSSYWESPNTISALHAWCFSESECWERVMASQND